MNRFKNTIILLSIIFIIKLMISCGPIKDIYPIYLFDYNVLKVSTEYAWHSNINHDTVKVDVVNRNKIRINIIISDTVKSYYSVQSKAISNFNGFATLAAYEPIFMEYYVANQTIKCLEIYTLQDFNDSIRSGNDISDEFLVDNGDLLYTKISKADKIFNSEYFEGAYNSINIACKIPSKAATGQFRVKVILSDNRILEAETQPVKFVENDEN